MEWSGAAKECSDVGAGGGGWRLKREAEDGVKVGGAKTWKDLRDREVKREKRKLGFTRKTRGK